MQMNGVLMEIVETSVFTRLINSLMDDETYRMLQLALITDPGKGSIIPGSGGLRKIRWKLEGHGKRGGVRVIYYWAVSRRKIVILYVFPKNVQDDLSKEQLKILREMVEREFE
jgi:hypothetical protein